MSGSYHEQVVHARPFGDERGQAQVTNTVELGTIAVSQVPARQICRVQLLQPQLQHGCLDSVQPLAETRLRMHILADPAMVTQPLDPLPS